MRCTLGVSVALFLFSVSIVSSGRGQADRPRVFHSAEVLSASDVNIPFNSVANGMVELHLTVGDTGKLEDVRVARPLVSVTEEAVRAVKTWSFAPATMQGKSIASLLTVCIVFCPAATVGLELPLPPITDNSPQDISADVFPPKLPEVIAATYPPDGSGRVVSGTVVLRVLVEADGQQSLVRVVRDVPTLTAPALVTIKDWKFSPAALDGKNAASGIVVAFAFRPPLSNSN